MLWQLILLPYLAESAVSRDFWFVRDFQERKVVVYPHKETIIQENEAITEAIKKVEGLVVGIESQNSGVVLRGSGLVLTSDGLVITLAELVPKNSNISAWVNHERVDAEVLKTDFVENLALLQLKKDGLSTAGFNGNVEKGEKVFLIGADFTDIAPASPSQGGPASPLPHQGGVAKIVNQGIVKRSDGDFIYTNITEKSALMGSVLFDIQGKVLGLNKIGLDGEVMAIPASRLRPFANL